MFYTFRTWHFCFSRLASLYPYNVWSCGAPNKPALQLLGSRHSDKSCPTTFATTAANNRASALLSPSKTNCKSDAVGMDQPSGIEVRTRLVKPPPGMKGTPSSNVEPWGAWSTGDAYVGMGSDFNVPNEVAASDGLFRGCN